MAIVLIAPSKNNLDYWQKGLQQEAERQNLSVPVWIDPEIEAPEKVKMAVVWRHPPKSLYRFPELRLISSMGAGVDHILKDKDMPAHWQISRIVDAQLTRSMSNYLLASILSYHKRMPEWTVKQAKQEWGYTDEPERLIKAGILGMGELGSDIAEKLVSLGFPVSGYSNSPKSITGVTSYVGEENLQSFLNDINVLVCLLPLTSKTRGFLNRKLFASCRKGTYLINVARGEHLVEEDLLWALDHGYIGGAMLDVFREEPLPAGHPFWQHPGVSITPHIASITTPDAAIPQIIDNYRRMQEGEPLNNRIERDREY